MELDPSNAELTPQEPDKAENPSFEEILKQFTTDKSEELFGNPVGHGIEALQKLMSFNSALQEAWILNPLNSTQTSENAQPTTTFKDGAIQALMLFKSLASLYLNAAQNEGFSK